MQMEVTLEDRAGKVPALEHRAGRPAGHGGDGAAFCGRGTGSGGGHGAGSGGVRPMVIPLDTLPAWITGPVTWPLTWFTVRFPAVSSAWVPVSQSSSSAANA